MSADLSAPPRPVRTVGVVLLMMLAVVGCDDSTDDAATEFERVVFDADTRVYDETGDSLSEDQIDDLEGRLRALADVDDLGTDAIVYVRSLDADPEATLDQTEALQQAWVDATDADQDVAVAILVNRNPDDSNDARAGLFVGSALDDGNVASGRQVDIIDDAVIPPLRDGDVHGAFVAGIEQLADDIVNEPTPSAFEEFADDIGQSWFPWVGSGVAAAGWLMAIVLFRRRKTTDRSDRTPTTTRPDNTMTPALAGALAAGGPQVSAAAATLLDLAARDAIVIEPESEHDGSSSKPTVQVRLADRDVLRDDVEQTLWDALSEAADADRVVSSEALGKAVRDTDGVHEVLNRQMTESGWLDESVWRKRLPLLVLAVVALGLGVFSIAVVANGEAVVAVVPAVLFFILAVAAFVFAFMFPTLSIAGQNAAIGWTASREGLEHAAKDDGASLDLDLVLADAVALDVAQHLEDRIEAANESGQALRAFTSGRIDTASTPGVFPWWIAFSSIVATSNSSAAGATIAAGGVAGGGGAAGST